MSRRKSTLTRVDRPPWAVLGTRLRDVRRQRRFSLSHVSNETGISTSFLSLLEKGETDISLGRLLPLLQFYGLSAAEVLDGGDEVAGMVVRAGEAPYVFSVAKGIDVFLAAPDRHPPFLPMIVTYEPTARMRNYSEHDGFEFIYVLEGSVRVEFRREETVVLEVGDALSFSSQRPHRFASAGGDRAKALIVATESARSG
jgi:transcriptional regulator with XRE-family HTH domain